jgi:hypothetical protein
MCICVWGLAVCAAKEISYADEIDDETPIIYEEPESIQQEKTIGDYISEATSKMKEIEKIEDPCEWFVAYKNIILEYDGIIDAPETIYDIFTDEELDLLFRVVEAEIGGSYSFEQKCNVVSVIYNRIEHESFGSSINEVLSPSQFQTIRNGKYRTVTVSELTILACEYAWSIDDPTKGCLFFDSNGTLNYKFAFNDGAHNFYYLK